jgi:hypothetical protein
MALRRRLENEGLKPAERERNELPRSKLRGINRKNLSIYLPAVKNLSIYLPTVKNLSIYLPTVKNLIERRSKLRGIKPPLGD